MGVPEEEQALGTPAIISNGKNGDTNEQKMLKKLFLSQVSYKKDRVLIGVLLLVIIALTATLIIVGVKRPTSCEVNNKESEAQKLVFLPGDSTDEVTETKTLKSAPCEDDWIWYRGKCYYFSTESDTWANSERFCKSHDASLVHIANKEELNFLYRYKGKKNHWIGLRRTEDNTAWTWTNGTLYDESLFKISRSLDENIEYAYLNSNIVRSQEERNTGLNWICEKM